MGQWNRPRENGAIPMEILFFDTRFAVAGGLSDSGHTAAADIKESEDESMIRTTMKIDGMMCGMCEAHVCDAIRKAVPEAKKVAASRSQKQASFLTEGAVDTGSLKAAVDATGYTCLGIESAPCEKKGLFGRR